MFQRPAVSKAAALAETMVYMRERGCTYEQRRYVANVLAGQSASTSLMPVAHSKEERIVYALTNNDVTVEIRYAPAEVPATFGR